MDADIAARLPTYTKSGSLRTHHWYHEVLQPQAQRQRNRFEEGRGLQRDQLPLAASRLRSSLPHKRRTSGEEIASETLTSRPLSERTFPALASSRPLEAKAPCRACSARRAISRRLQEWTHSQFSPALCQGLRTKAKTRVLAAMRQRRPATSTSGKTSSPTSRRSWSTSRRSATATCPTRVST